MNKKRVEKKNKNMASTVLVVVRHMGTMTDQEAEERVRQCVRGLSGLDWATGLFPDAPPGRRPRRRPITRDLTVLCDPILLEFSPSKEA